MKQIDETNERTINDRKDIGYLYLDFTHTVGISNWIVLLYTNGWQQDTR